MRRTFHQTDVDVGLQTFSTIKKFLYQNLGHCPEDYYYILPVGGFGELVFTLSQSHHLRKTAKVCVLLRTDRSYLAQIWPNAADYFMTISPKIYKALSVLVDQSYRSTGYLFICWADLFADGRFGRDLVVRENRITIKEMYSYALGLDLNVPLLPPVVIRTPEDVVAATPGKKVLLIQHANTVSRIPQPFWTALAEALAEKGYSVLIDVMSNEDIVTTGNPMVTYIKSSVPGLMSIAKAACAVVALRSGLTDFLGSCIPGSDTKMFALYHITKAFDATSRELLHTAGISNCGLNLARNYGTDGIHDIEILSEAPSALINTEVNKILGLL